MFPTITAFVPIHTSLPIVGEPSLFPRFSLPMVTPVAILTFLPITASGFIISLPKCPIYKPSPILVRAGI